METLKYSATDSQDQWWTLWANGNTATVYCADTPVADLSYADQVDRWICEDGQTRKLVFQNLENAFWYIFHECDWA